MMSSLAPAFYFFLQLGVFGDPGAWDSLTRAKGTAEEAKVALEERQELDLSLLDGREIVVLIQPKNELPVAELEKFMRDGGTLLLFGEGEAGESLLAHYGLEWVSAPLDHQPHLHGDQDFPIFSKASDESLFFNMKGMDSQLIGNHPSGVRLVPNARALDVLVAFGGDSQTAFVVETRVGLGRLMVITDTSVLIDEMQGKHGNKQFLANILRRHCLKEPCGAVWTTPHAPIVGIYTPRERVSSGLSALAARLVTFIRQAAQDPKVVLGMAAFFAATFFLSFAGMIRRDKLSSRRFKQAESHLHSHRKKEKRTYV